MSVTQTLRRPSESYQRRLGRWSQPTGPGRGDAKSHLATVAVELLHAKALKGRVHIRNGFATVRFEPGLGDPLRKQAIDPRSHIGDACQIFEETHPRATMSTCRHKLSLFPLVSGVPAIATYRTGLREEPLVQLSGDLKGHSWFNASKQVIETGSHAVC